MQCALTCKYHFLPRASFYQKVWICIFTLPNSCQVYAPVGLHVVDVLLTVSTFPTLAVYLKAPHDAAALSVLTISLLSFRLLAERSWRRRRSLFPAQIHPLPEHPTNVYLSFSHHQRSQRSFIRRWHFDSMVLFLFPASDNVRLFYRTRCWLYKLWANLHLSFTRPRVPVTSRWRLLGVAYGAIAAHSSSTRPIGCYYRPRRESLCQPHSTTH